MTPRGPLRDQIATAEQLESIITTTERVHFDEPTAEWVAIRSDPQHHKHKTIMLSDWRSRLICLGARYSLGVPIAELRVHFAKAVQHAPYEQWNSDDRVGSDFVEFFWLASWARLLDDTASLNRLREEVAVIGHDDSLLDAVLGDDPPGPLSVETYRAAILPPRFYRGLLEAAVLAQNGDATAAADRFRRYVRAEWYRSFRSAAWWGSHDKMLDYKGYWAYEAAGVAAAFGIDDSSLQGHKYYPWDLAHPDSPSNASDVETGDYDKIIVADPAWLPPGFTVVGASDPLQTEEFSYEDVAGLKLAPIDNPDAAIAITWGTEPALGFMADADPESTQVTIGAFDAVSFASGRNLEDAEPPQPALLWHDTNGAEVSVLGQPDTSAEELHVVAHAIAAITQQQFIDIVRDHGEANLLQP